MASDGLLEMAARIRSHPAYAAAAWRYAAEYSAWRDGLGPLNKAIANLARVRVLENLVYLHFLAPERAAAQGATFERLAGLSGAADHVGARAVRTVLRLAQTAGLVETSKNPADRRQRLYRPTRAMLRHCRHFTVIFMRPLESVFPGSKICERVETDPAYHRLAVIGLTRVYLEAVAEPRPQPEAFREIMRWEGAAAIFCVVIACFRSGRHVPSPGELSRRFFLSQSQVRAVFKAAEAAHLIEIAPRGRLIDAEPLAQAFSDGHIRVLAFCALHVFGLDSGVASKQPSGAAAG